MLPCIMVTKATRHIDINLNFYVENYNLIDRYKRPKMQRDTVFLSTKSLYYKYDHFPKLIY